MLALLKALLSKEKLLHGLKVGGRAAVKAFVLAFAGAVGLEAVLPGLAQSIIQAIGG